MNEYPHEHEALRIMRRRGMPLWARNVVATISEEHRLDMGFVIGRSRKKDHVRARNEVWYRLKITVSPVLKASPSYPTIGKWFERDHSSITFGACKHAVENDLPSPSGVDPEKLVTRKHKRAVEWWERKMANDAERLAA